MSINSDKVKIIFGLKIRQLRLDKKLSLSEVAEKANFSISYLNEIEKGKKYPKTEKIMALSEALGVEYDSLVSLKLSKQLEPIAELLNSNILSALPLEVFGIDPSAFVGLMADAPVKISAFINTIVKISRNYNISTGQFYVEVLRSYQEMNDNYFDELEQAAQQFRKIFEISTTTSPNESLLLEILQNFYGYNIEVFSEHTFPEFATVRSIYIPKNAKLMIHQDLDSQQKAFIYAREIAFQFLQLKQRSVVSPVLEINSFEEILNNFKASYLAGAILINKNILIDRLTYFFASPKWDENMLMSIMRLFSVTPEVFLHRVSNLMASHFKISNFFLFRFNHDKKSNQFSLKKEIHLTKLHTPHGVAATEHYCRRWISINILEDLAKIQYEMAPNSNELICKAQVSDYTEAGNQYFVISLAKASPPNFTINSSITLGFSIDDELKSMFKFLPDSSVQHQYVNETCERCTIADCSERVSTPHILEKQRIVQQMKTTLDKLH